MSVFLLLRTAELMGEVRIAELSKPMGCHKLGCVSDGIEGFRIRCSEASKSFSFIIREKGSVMALQVLCKRRFGPFLLLLAPFLMFSIEKCSVGERGALWRFFCLCVE